MRIRPYMWDSFKTPDLFSFSAVHAFNHWLSSFVGHSKKYVSTDGVSSIECS